MAGRMLAQSRNRSRYSIDSDSFDDGFWQHRRFKAKRRTGAATGGRGQRRSLRAAERHSTRLEVAAIREEL